MVRKKRIVVASNILDLAVTLRSRDTEQHVQVELVQYTGLCL